MIVCNPCHCTVIIKVTIMMIKVIIVITIIKLKVDMETHREVPTVEGMALAQFWNCPFVEASAKNRTNVNEVFAEIVREMNMKPEQKDREIICTCCCIS